jgi:hypothetical protein
MTQKIKMEIPKLATPPRLIANMTKITTNTIKLRNSHSLKSTEN